VTVAVLVMLVIWGVLYLVFREWRARYRERAAFGASQVVPAIDPMAEIVPPGVEPSSWRDAVKQTRALLLTVTASNLLDIDDLRALRAELFLAVARCRSHPDSGIAVLAGVWNSIADRAGFLLNDSRSPSGERHPRPRILPPRPEKPVGPAEPAGHRPHPRKTLHDGRSGSSSSGRPLAATPGSGPQR
jgi:hypothetical protein